MANLKRDLKEYKEIIDNLKIDMRNLKVILISLDNEKLKKEMLPYIREFYTNNIKTLMKQEDNEGFRMKKEIIQLFRDKAQLLLQIDWAEKKIKRNEAFIGVNMYRKYN